MELKHRRIQNIESADLCFNRTFMELKLQELILTDDRKLCFNRTFMELKHDSTSVDLRGLNVLIAPLWN